MRRFPVASPACLSTSSVCKRYEPMAIPPSTVKDWPVMYNAESSVAMNLRSRTSTRERARRHQNRILILQPGDANI